MSAAIFVPKPVARSVRHTAWLGAMALTVLVSSVVASHAQVVNGNFSSGISTTTALPSGSITLIPSWQGTIASGEAGCVVDASGGVGSTGTCSAIGPFLNPSNQSGVVHNADGSLGNLAAALPYVALMVDPSPLSATLQQSITLTAGNTYTLSFLEAMTENECDGTGNSCSKINGSNNSSGTTGITWAVSLGGDTLAGISGTTSTTTTITVSSNGTTNWVQENYTFTDIGSPELLKFIATGTNGGPPIALLDSVTITQTGTGTHSSVPEPATLAVLGFGVAGLVVARRRRAAANSDQGAGPGDAAAA